MSSGGGGGGGGVRGNQFPTFDAEFKFAKIQNSYVGGRGGFVETNFQLLMLSSNLLKKNFKKIAKNFLSFWAKMGMDLFWTLSTKWFAYTK